MALPTITFNSAGSDTQAAGTQGSVAQHGAAASVTNGVGTVTITDATINLTGLSTAGDQVIWVQTASGRQFSKITGLSGSVGNWTVTVEDTVWTTGSGKNWAVGGKRASLASSTQLGSDLHAGWTMVLETTQTLTAAWDFNFGQNVETTQTPIIVMGNQSGRTLITTSTNSINLFTCHAIDAVRFQHLAFSNTAGTKGTYAGSTGAAFASVSGNVAALEFLDCTFDGFVDALNVDNVTVFGCLRLSIRGCEFKNCTDKVIRAQFNNSTSYIAIEDTFFHGNSTDSVFCQNATGFMKLNRVIFADGTNGVTGAFGTNTVMEVDHCDFKGMSNAGLNFTSNGLHAHVTNCIFVLASGVTGIANGASEPTQDSGIEPFLVYNNAFYTNSGTNISNGPTSVNDVTLTGDPFNSSSDFGLNSTAGAGAACKGAAVSAPNASANTAGDLGAIPSGGGAMAGIGGPIVGNLLVKSVL